MEITYEELRERIPTLASYSGDEVSPLPRYLIFLQQAENWAITKITGQLLFDEITASVDDKAKKFCKDLICYKGYIEAMPFLDLIETGSGFSVTNNTNLAPASKDRVANLKTGLQNMLTTCIDDFIAYLEATPIYHPSWKTSATYSLLTDTFISTITEFNQFAKFTGNRLDFIAAHPLMQDAIRLKLANYISQELCDELLTEIKIGTISPSNEPIIDEVKFAYANFVVGLTEKAADYALRLQSYIITNITEFPTFATSSVYAKYLENIANTPTDDSILNTAM
jgi:hypothetical protein